MYTCYDIGALTFLLKLPTLSLLCHSFAKRTGDLPAGVTSASRQALRRLTHTNQATEKVPAKAT